MELLRKENTKEGKMILREALVKLDDLEELEWLSWINQILRLFKDEELEELNKFQNDWMESRTQDTAFAVYRMKFNEVLFGVFKDKGYDLSRDVTIKKELKLRIYWEMLKAWLRGVK